MSRSSYSINNKVHPAPIGNPDPFLIVEKSLELNGSQWVENVNLIEDILVQIVRKLGRDYPQLEATFVVRRLPNFMVPYTNKNEYAVILNKFDFSLTPYESKSKSSVDKVGKSNFGQIEIFLASQNSSDRACQLVHTPTPSPAAQFQNGETKDDDDENKEKGTMEDCYVFLNSNKAYLSHQVFKAWATAFTAVAQALNENDYQEEDQGPVNTGQVQLVGPHLLKDLRCNPEVSKIFQLISHPQIRLASNLREKCKISVNHLKSYISMVYEDTEVIIRPSLYYEHGYRRVNANLTERIPLYHPGMLTIGESLLKGCLIFPTSFDTLWTLQFWPSESHMTCRFHPSSIILRLYKIYGAFCLNPLHFYETLNANFLIGSLDDLDGFLADTEDSKSKLLPMDYFISSFLYELEEFSGVEDWAPRNFSTRLMHLLRSAIDSFDKGFHSHYYTRINVLRGLWRNQSGDYNERYCEREENSALKELDDIRESPDNVDDYRDLNMPRFMETDDLEDEFGLKFDELDIHDEDRASPPKLTSDLVYPSINPFLDETTPSRAPTASKGTTKSLSNFLKKLGGSRPSSEAGSLRNKLKGSPPGTVRSIAEVASEFEKSIALQRTRPSLFPFPISDEEAQGISSKLNLYSPEPGPSSQQQYDNEAFETGSASGSRFDSIYSVILQSLRELPPSFDVATEDPDMQQHLEKMKKIMQSQEELVVSWGKAMSEMPKPKFICPHAFTSRQIQYLARVIFVVSRCSPSTIKIVRSTKLPSWEISGDILRIVLHQMRSESVANANNNNHVINSPHHYNDLQQQQQQQSSGHPPSRKTSSFLINRTKSLISGRPGMFKSFKRDGLSRNNDPCKLHEHDQRFSLNGDQNRPLDPEEEMQLALEDPETAATNRLLQWLWQLRTSEIGRLSLRANRYLEELYQVSMVNSHFLEQNSEEKCFESLALRSAVAVTKIIETGKFPANVPLLTATKKGWLWAEMVLSLASWNQDKGVRMKAVVPVQNEDPEGISYLSKDINGNEEEVGAANGKGKGLPMEAEPDLDAVTLAFHSELATPIGWNDIEDPRQPGPYTVAILIFSSLGYYKLWEVIPGNLVHALVRLQKFNSLQHVGNMLSHPHRKTALNEVRKLNKSTSFRIHNFENNIMSKTFKRLASVRTTKSKKNQNLQKRNEEYLPPCLTCEEAGCQSPAKVCKTSTATALSLHNGREIECTKL